jgi:hypothetical protein
MLISIDFPSFVAVTRCSFPDGPPNSMVSSVRDADW